MLGAVPSQRYYLFFIISSFLVACYSAMVHGCHVRGATGERAAFLARRLGYKFVRYFLVGFYVI